MKIIIQVVCLSLIAFSSAAKAEDNAFTAENIVVGCPAGAIFVGGTATALMMTSRKRPLATIRTALVSVPAGCVAGTIASANDAQADELDLQSQDSQQLDQKE